MRLRRPARGWIIVGTALLAWLAIDRPWTIRPIGQSTAAASFDATAYVDGVWTSRVVPTIEAAAIDLDAFLASSDSDGDGPRAGVVEVAGRIVSVETSSRIGMALIDADPSDGSADAAIQVGPVIRGSALRDALDFISFSNFTNQIEFAAVARALNDRVLSEVLAGIDLDEIEGRRVRVTGVASHDTSAANERASIVPVLFAMEDR